MCDLIILAGRCVRERPGLGKKTELTREREEINFYYCYKHELPTCQNWAAPFTLCQLCYSFLFFLFF